MAIGSGKLAGLVVGSRRHRTHLSKPARRDGQRPHSSVRGDRPVCVPSAPTGGRSIYVPGRPAVPASGTVIDGLAATHYRQSECGSRQGGNADLVRDGGISRPGNPTYTYNTDRRRFLHRPHPSTHIRPRCGTDVRSFDAASRNRHLSRTTPRARFHGLRHCDSRRVRRRTIARPSPSRATSALSQETGVNLDEEMTNLLDLERTFQASSRAH